MWLDRHVMGSWRRRFLPMGALLLHLFSVVVGLRRRELKPSAPPSPALRSALFFFAVLLCLRSLRPVSVSRFPLSAQSIVLPTGQTGHNLLAAALTRTLNLKSRTHQREANPDPSPAHQRQRSASPPRFQFDAATQQPKRHPSPCFSALGVRFSTSPQRSPPRAAAATTRNGLRSQLL
ncbi:hypothetical protein B0T14DRAFT_587056 [Immersiella caudata]|uniref:Uncharacterized protein n=1 Tax=Immersiella caudata TaxID=314043 RepID=A0AA40C0P5_9PEZI|nr:hypothetical protein B0T14DRAFT_587056 [Immersiella caudata]